MFAFKSSRPSVVLVCALLLYGMFLVNFQIYHFGFQSLEAIFGSTNKWISVHDIYRFVFVLAIALWLVGYGHISPASLGLEKQKIPFAVLVTVLTWIIIQFVAAAVCLVCEHRLCAASPVFSNSVIRLFMGQVFGNSLLEEGVFRGYLIFCLSKYLMGSKGLALTASAILFALSHIPWFISIGRPFYYLIPIMVGGVLFGLLYFKTENLWLCIGIHSLIDVPAQLWGASPNLSLVPVAVGLLFIIIYPSSAIIRYAKS